MLMRSQMLAYYILKQLSRFFYKFHELFDPLIYTTWQPLNFPIYQFLYCLFTFRDFREKNSRIYYMSSLLHYVLYYRNKVSQATYDPLSLYYRDRFSQETHVPLSNLYLVLLCKVSCKQQLYFWQIFMLHYRLNSSIQ